MANLKLLSFIFSTPSDLMTQLKAPGIYFYVAIFITHNFFFRRMKYKFKLSGVCFPLWCTGKYPWSSLLSHELLKPTLAIFFATISVSFGHCSHNLLWFFWYADQRSPLMSVSHSLTISVFLSLSTLKIYVPQMRMTALATSFE